MDITRAGTDPERRLAVAILERAKLDAARGDVGALAWLIHTGAAWADTIADHGYDLVLGFCADIAQSIDNGTLRATWRIDG